MQPKTRAIHSYRTDPDVPNFDETRTLLVMDGQCAICSHAARRIARLDRDDRIRITTCTSTLGRALLTHYGFDPNDPASWLMVKNGRAYGSLDAMLRLGGQLHAAFKLLNVLRILPTPVQDWLYARLARNRYTLFGHDDLCALPPPDLKHRLVE